MSDLHEPTGGIVRDGVLERSPVGDHPQLSLGPAGPAAGILGWSGTLEATVTYVVQPPPVLGLLQPPPTERVEKVSLGLDAVNRGRGRNQVVLYTPPWSTSTRTGTGGNEAVLGGGALSAGTNVPVTLRAWRDNVANTTIPADGMVLSGEGAGSARMRAFWSKAADPAATSRSIVLRPALDRPVEESLGGHPVVLAGGRTVPSGTEPFATGRHPRTLVGWNSAGDLLLVTVDGRRPGHSNGVSLVEAADVLRKVGATSGFNLDGGGSTTFVSLASGEGLAPRVLNRPSDGSERRVSTVLAVVPTDRASVRSSQAAAPPPPPPAPPGPPPADAASTDGLDGAAATPPAPTTTIAPTTTAPPPTTVPPPPVTVTEPPEVVPAEVAAPPPPPPPPGRPSTSLPASIAALALLAAAAATLRASRRRGPSGPAPVPAPG